MAFSIIIPTYNRAHLIGRTLESCLNQTYPHFEIIVVDDGSTDNTRDVVLSFSSPKIQYFQIPNSERGYARNFGARQSRGEWLIFFDSDDRMYPHHLDTSHKIIASHPDILIFHTAFDILKENSNKSIQRPLIPILKGNSYSCNNVVIRKSLFEKFLFNQDRTIAGLEDWELWIRISAHHEIRHFPIVTSAIIQHNERSVMQIDKERWIKKVETFIKYVTSNPDVQNKFGRYFPAFYASAYSYLALHLSFRKTNRREAWHFFRKAIHHYPPSVLSRRAATILRNLLFASENV